LIQTKLLTSEHKALFVEQVHNNLCFAVFLITHRYRWVCQRCTRLPPFSFMYKHCRIIHMYM